MRKIVFCVLTTTILLAAPKAGETDYKQEDVVEGWTMYNEKPQEEMIKSKIK
jgi:hypothetical protein